MPLATRYLFTRRKILFLQSFNVNCTKYCIILSKYDVLSYIKCGSLLLTGLTNSQVVRTAEMTDIVAICFVRGKKPQNKTIELAVEKEAPLLATKFSMYEACGRLHKKGLPG